MTTALIDADGLIFNAAQKAEIDIEWEDDCYTLVGDLAAAKGYFTESLTEMLDLTRSALKIKGRILCLTDSGYDFRRDIWPTYKSKRGRKPLVYYRLREWVIETQGPTYLRDHLEADDILGILGTHKSIVKGPKVLVSIDKDLKQIPGLLFNPDKDIEPQEVTQEQGDHWHLMQTLMGDTVDGFPGCPGIGPKRAVAIADAGWDAVVTAFEKAGQTADDALLQARVARILTADLYDFKKKAPILWTP